jgi:hypothetical protein
MAKIVGNLVPEDDYTHPLGPEANFNESMYFNFFDREQRTGGFLRVGNRANEGQAEVTVTLFLPDGRVLFTFERPRIESNDAFDAAGVRFEVIEPTQRLRTTCTARLLELREPRMMADPRRAFAESPRLPVSLDLVHDAVGPLYGTSGSREEEGRQADQQFAKAHYEQHMRVRGRIAVGERELAIDGFGLRDHSWGPRSWQSIESYDWLTMNFGPDLGAMVSIVRRDADHVRRGGVLLRDGELALLTTAEVEAETEDNGLFHRAVRARFQVHSGERFEVSGRVVGFIPLRNRRGGVTTHIGEGMTEWRLGDRVGYGLSELLRRL